MPKGGNMNDRAYAKVQTQQKTLTGSSPGSRLLQRTCACGQHTIAGGECSACRNQRSTLHRSQRAFEPPSASAAAQGNSPVRENVSSSNTAINTVPRFGHDFSQIPVYSSHPPLLQTKLTVNQPGDVYEQEADQVAEQVMRMADPNSPLSDDEDERKASLMRKQSGEPEAYVATYAPPIVHDVLSSGGGQPLDATTRAFMEPRFGYDFSRVRVHTEARAAESAKAVNALAYTVGRDVVFGAEQYTPGTEEGKRLVAHELTHVIQQQGAKEAMQENLVVGQPDDEYEREAEISSTRMIKGYQTEQMPIDKQVGVARVQRKNKRRPEERFFPHQVFLGSGLSGRHNEKNKLRLWFHLQPESWQADAKNGSSPILVSTYYRIIDKSKPTFLVDVAPLTPQEQDVEKLLRETLGKEIKITTIRNFVDKNFEQLETADVNLSGS